MGCAHAGFRVKDGLFSWIIAVAMCMCMFIEGGICQSAGLFCSDKKLSDVRNYPPTSGSSMPKQNMV